MRHFWERMVQNCSWAPSGSNPQEIRKTLVFSSLFPATVSFCVSSDLVICCWGPDERCLHHFLLLLSGKPQPLVYYIPQEFFNALQHRLSLGSKKRRLPNITTGFIHVLSRQKYFHNRIRSTVCLSRLWQTSEFTGLWWWESVHLLSKNSNMH